LENPARIRQIEGNLCGFCCSLLGGSVGVDGCVVQLPKLVGCAARGRNKQHIQRERQEEKEEKADDRRHPRVGRGGAKWGGEAKADCPYTIFFKGYSH